MTFRRTDAEWLRTRPAQLEALSRVHPRVHAPRKGGRRQTAPQQGGLSDLMMLKQMRTV